jgi:hypothetical protein
MRRGAEIIGISADARAWRGPHARGTVAAKVRFRRSETPGPYSKKVSEIKMNSLKSSKSLTVKSNIQAGRVGIGTYKKALGADVIERIYIKVGQIDHTVAQ